MADQPEPFFAELSRRNVFRAVAIYIAIAWGLIEFSQEVVPRLGMPPSTVTILIGVFVVGIPVTVVLSALFDVTFTGIKTMPFHKRFVLPLSLFAAVLFAATSTLAYYMYVRTPADDFLAPSSSFSAMENSIAVLPFVDMSANKEYEHFADGISDVLIHQLSQLTELHVIARTSSFAFKGQQRDMRDIGRMLNVGRLLEGSVQRSNGKLRIAAQLIDTRTGTHVWSKLFDREEQDLFEIQDEIAIAVANSMDLEISEADHGRLNVSSSENLNAMEVYLVGRNELMMMEAYGGADLPLEYFNQALALDPNLALAWSGLADAYMLHAVGNKIPMGEALQLAQDAIDKALKLDPLCGEAHASNVLIAAMHGDLEKGRAAYNQSSALSPSYWPQYLWFGHLLGMNNMIPEASETYAKGIALQPYRPYHLLKNAYANSLIILGHYDQGMKLAVELMNEQRGTRLEQQYTEVLPTMAYDNQKYLHAIAYAEIAELRGFESVATRMQKAEAYLALGDNEEASRQLSIAEGELSKLDDPTGPGAGQWVQYVRGIYHLVQQNPERSIEILDAMLAEVYKIEEEAVWRAGSWAWYPAQLSLVNRRYEDLARLAEVSIQAFPQPTSYINAAFAHQMLGNNEIAEDYVEQAREGLEEWLSDEGMASTFDHSILAAFHMVDGNKQLAIESLASAANQEYPYLQVSMNPMFDGIRSNPEFINIMNVMKSKTSADLEAVHKARSTGDWQSLVAEHFEPSGQRKVR